MLRLLRRLSLGGWIGTELGGWIGTEMALSDQERTGGAGRVSGLILIDAVGGEIAVGVEVAAGRLPHLEQPAPTLALVD